MVFLSRTLLKKFNLFIHQKGLFCPQGALFIKALRGRIGLAPEDGALDPLRWRKLICVKERRVARGWLSTDEKLRETKPHLVWPRSTGLARHKRQVARN